MSQWGEVRRFGEQPFSFKAIPHVFSYPFEPIDGDSLIDLVIVTDQDRNGLDWALAERFVSRPYREWLERRA